MDVSKKKKSKYTVYCMCKNKLEKKNSKLGN